MSSLFDIPKCKCDIAKFVKMWKGKAMCSCVWQNRIPEKEIELTNDQKKRIKNDNLDAKRCNI